MAKTTKMKTAVEQRALSPFDTTVRPVVTEAERSDASMWEAVSGLADGPPPPIVRSAVIPFGAPAGDAEVLWLVDANNVTYAVPLRRATSYAELNDELEALQHASSLVVSVVDGSRLHQEPVLRRKVVRAISYGLQLTLVLKR